MNYVFIIGWVEGSPSANGQKTGLHNQEDLLKSETLKSIFTIEANNIDEAYNKAIAKAWEEDYTNVDTISILLTEEEFKQNSSTAAFFAMIGCVVNINSLDHPNYEYLGSFRFHPEENIFSVVWGVVQSCFDVSRIKSITANLDPELPQAFDIEVE